MQELVKIIHHILSQHYHKLFNKFQHIFIMRQQTRQQTLQQVSTNFNKMNEYRFSFTAYSTNSSSTFIHIHFNKSWYNSLSTSTTYFILFFITSSTNKLKHIFNKHFNKLFDKIFNDKLHDEDYSFQQMYSQIMIQCSSHAL